MQNTYFSGTGFEAWTVESGVIPVTGVLWTPVELWTPVALVWVVYAGGCCWVVPGLVSAEELTAAGIGKMVNLDFLTSFVGSSWTVLAGLDGAEESAAAWVAGVVVTAVYNGKDGPKLAKKVLKLAKMNQNDPVDKMDQKDSVVAGN